MSPPAPFKPTIYTGTFISAPSLSDELEILGNYAVAVNANGIIVYRAPLDEWDAASLGEEWEWADQTAAQDTHIHASQYPNVGLFGKTTLLDWLNTYTFPLEASLSSIPKARRVYSACVSRTLSHGTTTACYYATKHGESTNLLADICLAKGQRAFIGRVCMDTDLNPEYYRDESPEQALQDTRATIEHIKSIDPDHSLITPIITPRFAPSCSSGLLAGLGDLAQKTSLPVQTHLSENKSEIALVHKLFPTEPSYTSVYDSHNLLTPKTVLAHAIHLSPDEKALIKTRESKISHCPVSNTSLSSGLCPVRDLLDRGIDVGLGTDVSGGYSASVLVAAREAAMVSRTLAAVSTDADDESAREGSTISTISTTQHSSSKFDRKKLSVEECLYLATKGGAKCLGLERKIGGFELGMHFDAQFIQLGSLHNNHHDDEKVNKADSDDASHTEASHADDDTPITLWGTEIWSEKVAKWLFCGDDRNTKRVYVGGRLVHRRR